MIKRKITINAPIETVFAVIRDFRSYPEFLSTTRSAKERKVKGETHIDFEVHIMKTIRYTLKVTEHPPHELSWTLVKGDLMKKNSGGWKLSKISNGKTKAEYHLDIDFGWLVPKSILETVTKIQLPEMLEAFKNRAEEKAVA